VTARQHMGKHCGMDLTRMQKGCPALMASWTGHYPRGPLSECHPLLKPQAQGTSCVLPLSVVQVLPRHPCPSPHKSQPHRLTCQRPAVHRPLLPMVVTFLTAVPNPEIAPAVKAEVAISCRRSQILCDLPHPLPLSP
jgi:hypothetical protein